MTESAWNKFLQYGGSPAAPQIKWSWFSWPLEWDVSKLAYSAVHTSSRNDFWCPGATLVTALDSFIIMNLTNLAETGKKWISTELSSAIAEVNMCQLHLPKSLI